MAKNKIVSQNEWIAARKAFLEKEKAFLKSRDALNAELRDLPWVKIDADYRFRTKGGEASLSDLFGGRSQLIVYHFMFGPDWEEGCPSCSLIADGFDGANTHLAQRDVSLVVVSRAPLEKLLAYKARMGWRFNWVSSAESAFNADFHVSFDGAAAQNGKVLYNYRETTFPSSEAPGISVFVKQDGAIFHTYSSYARGLDRFLQVYRFLDIVPKGRDEEALDYPMAWVRRHDSYQT